MRAQIFRISVAILSATALGACEKPADLAKGAPGKYQGFATLKDSSGSTEILLDAEAKADGAAIALNVSARPGDTKFGFRVAVKDSKSLSLQAPSFITAELALRKAAGDCFSTEPGADTPRARLCFDGHELAIELLPDAGGSASIVLDKTDGLRPVLETPASFSLEQLTQRAMDRSFESRIDFEQAVQAKQASRNAYLNLLPHFSFNTFFAFVNIQLVQVIRSVGDLAPFLLPSRWLKAKGAAFQAEAELEAWLLMKADAANLAQGLSYAILRDERTLARFAAHKEAVSRVFDRVQSRELLGLLPAGASDDIAAMLEQLDSSTLFLQQTLREEYANLAQATGFINPTAITAVTAELPGIEKSASGIDLDLATNVAIDRSLELRQMETLIAQAKLAKVGRFFNWLDPQGENAGALGAGLLSYVEIGASQVRELEIKREKLQSIVLAKTTTAVGELRTAGQAHSLAARDVDLQDRRLNRILDELTLGKSISTNELLSTLQSRLKADLDLLNAEFMAYVSRSKLDRSLFSGSYAEITALKEKTPVKP